MQTESGVFSKSPAGWAACPNIQLGGAAEKPRLFRTKFDATCWLKRPLPEPSAEHIAQQFGLRVEDIIARRDKNKARYRLCRAMYDHGKLSALAFPSELMPRTPDNQGFQKPVPISMPAEESGPAAKSLSAFLPLSSIGRWIPKFDLNNELSRALDGNRLSPAIRCYLGRGWRFDEIEADTWKRCGHEYAGLAHKSIGEIIVKALYDLDISLGRFHPKLSNYARADFWRSWQVDDHIARFCGMLAQSEEAAALAREGIWDETNRAREWVSLQLELYAAELKDTSRSVFPTHANKTNVVNNTVFSVEPRADDTRTESASALASKLLGASTSNSENADQVMQHPTEQRVFGAELLHQPDRLHFSSLSHGDVQSPPRTIEDIELAQQDYEILRPEQRDISSVGPLDTGNLAILRGIDGKLKDAVTLDTARRFGGVSRRAIEKTARKGSLHVDGERLNRRVSVQSLLKYFPPENMRTDAN